MMMPKVAFENSGKKVVLHCTVLLHHEIKRVFNCYTTGACDDVERINFLMFSKNENRVLNSEQLLKPVFLPFLKFLATID